MDKQYLNKENCEFEYLLDQQDILFNDDTKNENKNIGRNLFTQVNVIQHKVFKTYPEDYNEGTEIIQRKLLPSYYSKNKSNSKDKRSNNTNPNKPTYSLIITPIKNNNTNNIYNNYEDCALSERKRIYNSENNSIRNHDTNTHTYNQQINSKTNILNYTNIVNNNLPPLSNRNITNTNISSNNYNKFILPENLKYNNTNININPNSNTNTKRYVSLHKIIKRPSYSNLRLDNYSDYLKMEISGINTNNNTNRKRSALNSYKNITNNYITNNSESDEISKIMNTLANKNRSDKKENQYKPIYSNYTNKKMYTEGNTANNNNNNINNINKSLYGEGFILSGSHTSTINNLNSINNNLNTFNKSNKRSAYLGSEMNVLDNNYFLGKNNNKASFNYNQNNNQDIAKNLINSTSKNQKSPVCLGSPIKKVNTNTYTNNNSNSNNDNNNANERIKTSKNNIIYNHIVTSNELIDNNNNNNDNNYEEEPFNNDNPTSDFVEYNFRVFYKKEKDKFLEKTTKGAPSCFRWLCWMVITGIPTDRSLQLFDNCLFSNISSDIETQIKKDLTRTLPRNVMQCLSIKEISEKEFSLYRVLRAFAANDTEVSYCQGMNYIVSFLLQISRYNELEAFYMTLSLFSNTFYDKLGVRGFYTSGFSLLNFYIFLFHHTFRDKLPKLYKHLIKDLELTDDAWISKWFMTLYTMIFPLEVVSRIWDCLLVVGLEFLISFAVAYLSELESKLFKFDDPFDVVDFFKTLSPFECNYSEKLMNYTDTSVLNNNKDLNIHNQKSSGPFIKQPSSSINKNRSSFDLNDKSIKNNYDVNMKKYFDINMGNKDHTPYTDPKNNNVNNTINSSSVINITSSDKINLENLISAALKIKIPESTIISLRRKFEDTNNISLSVISKKYDLNKSIQNSILDGINPFKDNKKQGGMGYNKSNLPPLYSFNNINNISNINKNYGDSKFNSSKKVMRLLEKENISNINPINQFNLASSNNITGSNHNNNNNNIANIYNSGNSTSKSNNKNSSNNNNTITNQNTSSNNNNPNDTQKKILNIYSSKKTTSNNNNTSSVKIQTNLNFKSDIKDEEINNNVESNYNSINNNIPSFNNNMPSFKIKLSDINISKRIPSKDNLDTPKISDKNSKFYNDNNNITSNFTPDSCDLSIINNQVNKSKTLSSNTNKILFKNSTLNTQNEGSMLDECQVNNELENDCIDTKIEHYKFNFANKMTRKPKTSFYESPIPNNPGKNNNNKEEKDRSKAKDIKDSQARTNNKK